MRKILSFLASLILFPLWLLIVYPVKFILPVHVRRMFFMTTLYVRLTGLKDPGAEQLKPLVDRLGVAKTVGPTAVVIPAMFEKLVWSKVALDTELSLLRSSNRDTTKEVCLRIVNMTPSWMLYGRKDDMLADLLRLLGEIPQQRLLAAV